MSGFENAVFGEFSLVKFRDVGALDGLFALVDKQLHDGVVRKKTFGEVISPHGFSGKKCVRICVPQVSLLPLRRWGVVCHLNVVYLRTSRLLSIDRKGNKI